MPKTKKPFVFDIAAFRRGLGQTLSDTPMRYWLNTGHPHLHRVLGSESKGISYGKIFEISGNESNGKTALALELAKYAQEDGAYVIWVDFENSYDPIWFRKRGLRLKTQFTLVDTYLKFKTAKKGSLKKQKANDMNTYISSCEDICWELRIAITRIAKHYKKIMVIVDSIAAMETEKESKDEAAMGELARFLSKTLRKWLRIGQVYNAMFVLLNQLRVRPMAFGDPEYTTGGRGIPFYAASRIRLRLVKGGRLVQGNKTIGVKGTISNFKNKVGAGSVPYERCGFKIYYEKPAKFVPYEEVKGE